jgi:hypothetical protein
VLAKAGIAASARVGDEDLVQMTEDELRSFAADEVLLVDDERGRAAAELRARLSVPLHVTNDQRAHFRRSTSGVATPLA